MFGNSATPMAPKAPDAPPNPPMFGSQIMKPKKKNTMNTYLGDAASASPFQLAEQTLMGGGS